MNKTADKTTLVVGETVTYTFVVENTGNVTISNVTVTDTDLPDLSEIKPKDAGFSGVLAPGASAEFVAY